jgi:5-methylcytosine-specific restriction protein A
VLLRLCNACGGTFEPQALKRGRCADCLRQYYRKRGKTRARGYDAEHKRLVKLAIAAHPYCVDCGASEDLTGDHIVPRSRGGLNVLSNYEVRCRGCNTARRNREAGFLRDRPGDPRPGRREKEMQSRSASAKGRVNLG